MTICPFGTISQLNQEYDGRLIYPCLIPSYYALHTDGNGMRTNKLHVQRNLFMLLFCNKIQIYHDKLAKTRLKFIQNETNKLASEVELFCYLLNIGITIVENYFTFLIFSSVEEVKGIPEHRVATGRLLFVIHLTYHIPLSTFTTIPHMKLGWKLKF